MPYKQKSKIEREKMDYLKGLFYLCIRIDKEIVAIEGYAILGLHKIERGVDTLERRLQPFTSENDKIKEINTKIRSVIPGNKEGWQKRFDAILEKYGLLHQIMDDENMLLKEQEEVET